MEPVSSTNYRKVKVVLLFMLFSMSSLNVFARQLKINDNVIIEGEIIAASPSCIIIEAKDPAGNPMFWVISQVANALIPKAAHFVCLKIVGENNQGICDAIIAGLNFLYDANNIARGTIRIIDNVIEMTAHRGDLNSGLQFVTNSMKLAINIKSTLEAYQKLGIVNWNNIEENYSLEAQYNYIGEVTIENVTNKNFVAFLSKDGVDWYYKDIAPGSSKKFQFWKGYEKQNYGFLKSTNICNYQMFTDRTYKIRYDKNFKQYYIIEK